jgi:hypothetical protein
VAGGAKMNRSVMPTVPLRSARATRNARDGLPVYTPAERPYSESLAMRIACSSVSNGMTDRTGPNSSSRAIAMRWSTSANSVGSTQLPARRAQMANPST